MNNRVGADGSQGSRWLWWLLGGAALIVGLFMCGIVAAVLWNRGIIGGDSNNTVSLQPPTRPVVLSVPTPLATDLPLTLAPTATLIDAATTQSSDDVPTTVPVATATIPPNGSVSAFRVQTPFVIDGNLDGWSAIPSYASAFRVYAISDWDGSDDVEAFWRLAWDSDNLYVAVLVTDDVHVQTQTGNLTYRGDSLEMQFDTDRNGDYGPGLSPDDYQIVLSPGNFADIPPSVFRFRGQTNGQMGDFVGHAIEIRSQQTDNGYVVEAAIPWIDLGARPAIGQIMGLSLNVNDNDTPNTARQEVLKSHVSTRVYRDPNTWGLLILTDSR